MATVTRRRVLVIDNSKGISGALKSIGYITDRLKYNFDFYFALDKDCSPKSILSSKKQKYYTFNFIEIQKKWKVVFYFPMLFWNSLKLIILIKKENIEIVHVNDLYNMTGIIIKIFYPKIKLIYHIRLLPNSYVAKFYKIWVALIEKYADYIICVSKAVFNSLPKNDKTAVIYDAMPHDERYGEKVIKDKKSIEIIYLGNLIPGKGQDIAIEAFKIAFDKNRNLILKFIGDDPTNKGTYKIKLLEKVNRHNLNGFVTFAQYDNDIEKRIKEADIALNLSESESFSMVCLEALKFGTPLIATDCGGPRELFENGKSGILISNKDIHAAAKAILILAKKSKMREKFSIAGKAFVKKNFDIDKSASLINSIYSS